MQIRWIYDLEATRLCYRYTWRDIEFGFFQANRFYVLPKLPAKFRDRIVFYPEKIEPSSALRPYQKAFQTKLSVMQKLATIYLPKVQKFITGNVSKRNYKMAIAPTFVGSVGQYDFFPNENITVYPRFDRTMEEIFCLILTAIIEYEMPKPVKQQDWVQKQTITKRLFADVAFRSIFPKIKDMTEILEENTSGERAIQSAKYLLALGHPIVPLLNDVDSLILSSSEEQKLIQLFVSKRSKLVTYPEIALALWSSNAAQKYSPFAIAKLVERLRASLQNNSVPRNIIESYRGKGYVLYD